MSDLKNYYDALRTWDRKIPFTWDGLKLALLYELWAELQSIRRYLSCDRFLSVPEHLAAIRRNTAKVKKRTVRKAKKARSKR